MIGLAQMMMEKVCREVGVQPPFAEEGDEPPSRNCDCDGCAEYFRLVDACPLRIPVGKGASSA
jgi:hypothetical protein